jgi:hypothetical protein
VDLPSTTSDPSVSTDPSGSARSDDLVAEDIAEAVGHLEDGRVTLAHRRLSALWPHLTGTAARHRCAAAHWLAAAENDLTAKLTWDERALDEAEAVPDWATPFAGAPATIGSMYPELHLELARDYQRFGEACAVLEHLELARNAADTLPPPLRGRVRREAARIDRAGRSGAAARESWGWDRAEEADLADFWDGSEHDEAG